MQPTDDEMDRGLARAKNLALSQFRLAVYKMSEEKRQALTDMDLRSMDWEEPYPGYFQKDPRRPENDISAVDRYLMDHPGPDWRTKEKIPRSDRPENIWEGVEATDPIDYSRVKILPLKPMVSSANAVPESLEPRVDFEPDEKPRTSGLYICRVCSRTFALWPTERSLRFHKWGLSWTLVFRSPFACTNCRILNQQTVQALGREDHRIFWRNVIAVWEGKSPPTAGKGTQTWVARRNALLRAGARVMRVFRHGW